MIYIVDFGSQTTHLISRRLKDLGVKTKIIESHSATEETLKSKALGIVLSGGPSSVYGKGAPTIDKKVFDLEIPILGICYGFQLTTKLLGGKVIAGKKEYGPAKLELRSKNHESRILEGLDESSTVWQSHGDEVKKIPNGFETIASTPTVPYAFVADFTRKIFGVQFHPEVEHTENGIKIFENFVKICEVKISKKKINIRTLIEDIKKTVGDSCVIGAVSGGVDSTVASVLTAKAISKNFYPVYVDNGLMREGTEAHLKRIFKHIGIKLTVLKVEKEMIKRLRGITDPEEKRKIIGNFYIELFEKEMKKLIKKGIKIKFLMQGTIYSDVIESKGTKHSDKIKSHHNVGGLPSEMKLKLLEPLRNFYKDEVRKIGKLAELPEKFIWQQVFPGPGYAIRIRGEVTKERLEREKIADNIILEELPKAVDMKEIYMSFPVMTGAYSTAVKGDARFFGEVIAVRIVESSDVMTSTWSRIPYGILQRISSRIVNEVPGISRVVYDITTKPPATMEWE